MDLRNCVRCGKIFAYTIKPICPDCVNKEEDDFNLVRDYIKENPGSSLQEVSEATGVSDRLIIKFLRDKRIEITGDNSVPLLQCEKCGKPIYNGRMCNECLSVLGKELSSIAPKKSAGREDGKDVKMHLSRFSEEKKKKNT